MLDPFSCCIKERGEQTHLVVLSLRHTLPSRTVHGGVKSTGVFISLVKVRSMVVGLEPRGRRESGSRFKVVPRSQTKALATSTAFGNVPFFPEVGICHFISVVFLLCTLKAQTCMNHRKRSVTTRGSPPRKPYFE